MSEPADPPDIDLRAGAPDEQPGGPGEPGPADGDGVDDPIDDRVGDGVEHLQAAAREMIAAARSFLDVVEDVVGDHVAVTSLADALGSMSQVVARAGNRAREAASGPSGTGGGAASSRVQHIDVS